MSRDCIESDGEPMKLDVKAESYGGYGLDPRRPGEPPKHTSISSNASSFLDVATPSGLMTSIDSGYRSSIFPFTSITSAISKAEEQELITRTEDRVISPEPNEEEPTTLTTTDERPVTIVRQPTPTHVTLCDSNYTKRVDNFFNVFVDGLSLREDTVYCVMNIDAVKAVGFGIKTDRVVPCIRLFATSKRPTLVRDAATHIMTSLLNLRNILVSLDDCMECLELDDFTSAKIRPEELTGRPGEQFKVNDGIVRGTIGYYMKAQLDLTIGGRSETLSKHFGVTCAHCAFPVNAVTRLIVDVCRNKEIQEKFQHYPLRGLYEHMWSDREHKVFHAKSKQEAQNGIGRPPVYSSSGYIYERELCLIKGSICCSEMRQLINEKISYEDDSSAHPPQREYNFVVSKFGMIPKDCSVPLPSYLFKNLTRDCETYHFPFNVDVALLELTESPSSDPNHCLQSSAIGHTLTIDKNKHSRFFTSNHVTRIPGSHVNLARLPENDQCGLKVEERPLVSICDSLQRSPISSPLSLSGAPPPLNNPPFTRSDSNDIPIEHKEDAVKGAVKRLGAPLVALGRNIFGLKESNKLELQTLSHQASDDRPPVRSIDVRNDEFCLEFVHKNESNKLQRRSFPTVKWNYKNMEQSRQFIKGGDSGSSLFIMTKDGQGKKRPVLLGVVNSAYTATRVDFVKDVLSHDVLMYMTSELEKQLTMTDNTLHDDFISSCQSIKTRVEFNNDLRFLDRLADAPNTTREKDEICSIIKEKHQFVRSLAKPTEIPIGAIPSASCLVTFKLTECIDCKS
jgi:hypothetical protein